MEKYQPEDQCQHPGCECERPSIGDYCSDYCRNAHKGGMGNQCKCGHSACS